MSSSRNLHDAELREALISVVQKRLLSRLDCAPPGAVISAGSSADEGMGTQPELWGCPRRQYNTWAKEGVLNPPGKCTECSHTVRAFCSTARVRSKELG